MKKTRAYPLHFGDVLYAEEPLDPMLKDTALFKIIEIFYYPKKWWQFWKKKVPKGYNIMFIGNNTCGYKEIKSNEKEL
jgi:hypothetical protein